jgi:glycosyltransferase involved in cell wall biosynthesis
MRVVFISTDIKIFDVESSVHERFLAYTKVLGDVHVIVHAPAHAGQSKQSIGSLHLYPTNTNHKISFFGKARRLVAQIEKQQHIDVITAQDPFETGIVAAHAAKKWQIPLHVQVHADIGSPYFATSVFQKIRKFIGIQVLHRAKSIRVVSKSIAAFLQKLGIAEERIAVIPLVIQIQEDHDEIQKEQFCSASDRLFLMASRFTKEKHIDMAIDAFAAIWKEKEAGHLVIIGEGPLEENYKEHLAQLHMTAQVTLLPWQKNIMAYMRVADIFVLTSLYEGYGRTLVEAAALATPIITTNVGCAEDVVKNSENGMIVPVDDLQALKEVIKLGMDEEVCEQWKRGAQNKSLEIKKSQHVQTYIQTCTDNIKQVTHL